MSKKFLLFGSSGVIGSACKDRFKIAGDVYQASHVFSELKGALERFPTFDGVVWAQGLNSSDSIVNFDKSSFNEIQGANLEFVLISLNLLLSEKKLAPNCQLVVISSIWGSLSRPNKLSYSVSKAALMGAVRSIAVDLGPLGISINAVSPGPVDSPMTRKNLSPEQVNGIISDTPMGRLPKVDEISQVVFNFATGQMSGVTGQEVVIDGGWGVGKLVSNNDQE